MLDTYVHLTQIAQKCGKALGVAQWDILDFDDLFTAINTIDNANANDLLIRLYNYANAYGGYAHLRHLYGLKSTHTAQETEQYDAFRTRAGETRTALVQKIAELEEVDEDEAPPAG